MQIFEDTLIMEVDASATKDGRVRLKYVAVSGGCGPEIVMSERLAWQTVGVLLGALGCSLQMVADKDVPGRDSGLLTLSAFVVDNDEDEDYRAEMAEE
jgi:hypothetical protein